MSKGVKGIPFLSVLAYTNLGRYSGGKSGDFTL